MDHHDHPAREPLDLLSESREIAEFLYGTRSKKNVRRVQHLIATGQIPTHKFGTIHVASRAVLRRLLPLPSNPRPGGPGECGRQTCEAPPVGTAGPLMTIMLVS